jgi:hypothetical protein
MSTATLDQPLTSVYSSGPATEDPTATHTGTVNKRGINAWAGASAAIPSSLNLSGAIYARRFPTTIGYDQATERYTRHIATDTESPLIDKLRTMSLISNTISTAAIKFDSCKAFQAAGPDVRMSLIAYSISLAHSNVGKAGKFVDDLGHTGATSTSLSKQK